MPDRKMLRLWQVTALSALGACGLLSLRSPPASRAAACAEPTDQQAPTTQRGAQGARARASHSVRVRQLSESLALTTDLQGRCVALSRLARIPALDASAVAQIASFTGVQHSTEQRHCAIAALTETRSDAAVPFLIALLQDAQTQIAESAVRALANYDEPSAREAVLASARSGPENVRVVAVMGLAEAGATEAVPLIAELLEQVRMQYRHQLIEALGTSHDPRALPILQGLLGRGVRSLQHASVFALGELGGAGAAETLVGLLEREPTLAPMVAQALARNGSEEAREALLGLAESAQGGPAAQSALAALAQSGAPEVEPLMAEALASENPNRVGIAIEYYGAHPSSEVQPMLLRLAREGGPRHAWSAVQALARSGGESSRALLVELAQRGGPSSQAALAMLSTQTGGAEAARAIALERLKKGGPSAAEAIDVIAGDDSPEAQAALLAAASSEDARLSMQSLHYLGQRSDEQSLRVLDRLAAEGKDEQRRGAALAALIHTGDPRARERAAAALKDPSSQVRVQAVQALGQVGGAHAEQLLVAASSDRDPEVARTATFGLAQVGSPAALTRLEQLARGSDPAMVSTALTALGQSAPERAAPLAEALMAGSDPALRATAVQLTGVLPEAASARIVGAAMRDQNPDVVRATLDFLGATGGGGSEDQRAALRAISESEGMPSDLRERAAAILAGRVDQGRELAFRARF